MVFKNLKNGKKANWLASLNYKHSFTYTPDAGWTGVASVLYALQDSNIPFYESDVTGASLSVLYSF